MRKQPSRYKRRPKGQVREVFNTRYHLKTQTKLPLMRTYWLQHDISPLQFAEVPLETARTREASTPLACLLSRRHEQEIHGDNKLHRGEKSTWIWSCHIRLSNNRYLLLHFALCSHAQNKTKQNKTKKGAQVEPKQISRSLNLSRSSKAERISVIIRKSCEIA